MATTIGEAAAATSGDKFDAAHRQLLTDPTLQFQFQHIEKPKPPDTTWLEPLMRFLEAIAPFLGYVFWAGVFVILALIAYAILSEIVRRLPTGSKEAPPPPDLPEPKFRPAAARARALLEEADRLAREGRFGEAVRVLLRRSIDDMERAFPAAIVPSMTSREISRLQHLSTRGRATFTKIAQAVEASLFGGRALSEAQFVECRRAYETFAFEAPAT
jgi:hypothetical protein